MVEAICVGIVFSVAIFVVSCMVACLLDAIADDDGFAITVAILSIALGICTTVSLYQNGIL